MKKVKQTIPKKQEQNATKSDQMLPKTDAPQLSTERMSGENIRQYTAWLLYHRVGALRKLFDVWNRVSEIEGGMEMAGKLKQRPDLTTLKRWSSKYQWVKRSELMFEETLAGLKEQTIRIDRERKDRIAQLFQLALDKKVKQLNLPQGEPVSDTLFNYLWRMHRVEQGLPTDYSKHDIFTPIREEDQKPLTPEEIELSKKITQLEIEHNARLNQ